MPRQPIRGVREALCALFYARESQGARRFEYDTKIDQVVSPDGHRFKVLQASETIELLKSDGFDDQGIEHALKVILREPCPRCSEPTRLCATGEPGCHHCDACGWCGS